MSDMDALTEKAKEMGAKTKFSAGESAEAFQYMAMAGWKTNDMLGGIEGIMNLAAASGEDLATTSDIVTDALTAFGMSASDSGRFADILAAASSNANTNVSMMGETFKYVAPVAGAMGFSAEDCATAIGLMANSGIKAGQAGTSLRAIFTRMAKPTDEVQAAMEQLGISITNSDGSMKDLNTIMKDLRSGFSGLTEEQKTQMAATLGGQEAMSGLLAIVSASDEDFEKLSSSIYNSQGAAQEMAETMMDNLPGAIEQASGALETLGLSFYEKVQDPLKDTVNTITGMIDEMNQSFTEDGFDGLTEAIGSSLAELTQMAVDVAPDLIQAGLDISNALISGIMENSGQFAESGAFLATQIITAIVSFGGNFWSAAATLFTQFLAGMAENMPQIIETARNAAAQFAQSLIDNAPMIGASATRIITEIVTALGGSVPEIISAGKQIIQGLIEGISQESPQVGALLTGVFEGFTDTVSPVIDGVQEAAKKLFDALQSVPPETLEKVGKAIGVIAGAITALKVANTVIGPVKALFGLFGGGAGGIAATVGVIPKLAEGFGLLAGGAGTFSEVLALEFPKIAGTVGKISGLFAKGGTLVTTVGGALSGLGTSAIAGITSLGSTIATGIGGIVATLGGPLTIAIAAAVAGLIAVICNWDAVKGFFTETLPAWWNDTALPFFESLITSLGEWFAALPERLGEFFVNVLTWLAGLPEQIIGAIGSLGERFTEWAGSVKETVSAIVPQIIEAIVQFFTQLPGKIGYAIGFVLGTLAQWAVNAVSWVIANVPGIIAKIVEFFAQLPGKIWEWMKAALSKIGEWGSQALQWIVNNVPGIIAKIVTFFSQLPGKIWEWLKNAIGKISEWGKSAVQKAGEIGSNFLKAVVKFFMELPGKIWEFLKSAVKKIFQWGGNLAEAGRDAASELFNSVINGVSGLPGRMVDIGADLISGVWNGIQNAAGWFADSVWNFFSGIVDGAKSALGIASPSRVFADEVGRWIPPGIGRGVEKNMPSLYSQMDDEMEELGKRMRMSVNMETGKIAVDKNTSTAYNIAKETQGVFESGDTTVEITGETHVHVDLDGKEVGNATTPVIDENMARIDTHKKRGG